MQNNNRRTQGISSYKLLSCPSSLPDTCVTTIIVLQTMDSVFYESILNGIIARVR